ncbi:hypothetical protein Tco_0627653 [Tanacetum coccineum]|uniref:Uncharacterized protein n=1 Tax=Tanacetum coccineum TaxID=301880 RepID=A0ABQ4WN27_9ASTR
MTALQKMSLAEAEYVSLFACSAEVVWLITELTDYGFHFDKIPILPLEHGISWVLGKVDNPNPSVGTNQGIMEMKPDIESKTINEYLEYEAAMNRQLWDNVRSRRSPTNYDEADFDTFHWNKRAENLKRMGHDKVRNRCDDDTSGDMNHESDVDLKEDHEEDGDDGDIFDMWDITVEDVERIRQFLTPNVPDEMDEVIQPLIPQLIHTTPPNDDYVALATKLILDKLLGIKGFSRINKWYQNYVEYLIKMNTISIQDLIIKEKMRSQSETTQTVFALKLPVLKTGDYDLWSMRMEKYITHTDYALWEVIVNGDAPAIASASAGIEGPIPLKTAETKA